MIYGWLSLLPNFNTCIYHNVLCNTCIYHNVLRNMQSLIQVCSSILQVLPRWHGLGGAEDKLLTPLLNE